MEFENDNETRFTMRMETSLYNLLKESAKRNKRSVAKELEYITETYLKNDSKDETEFLCKKLVANFMQSPAYDDLLKELKNQNKRIS